MKLHHWIVLATLSGLLVGCAGSAEKGQAKKDSPKLTETKEVSEETIKANLAKLNDDDREEAELQKYCAVQTKHRLGSMGVPDKITIKNKEGEEQAVYLCCKGCEKEARKDEAKTAARVDGLKIQGNLVKLSPEDRKAAEAQKFCAKWDTSLLGSMGPPTKVMLKDADGMEKPVFFCCGGCQRIIKELGPEKTLARVEDLKKKNALPK